MEFNPQSGKKNVSERKRTKRSGQMESSMPAWFYYVHGWLHGVRFRID